MSNFSECQYRTRKTWPWKRRVIYGGFAAPEVLDFLDCEPKVEYLVNFAANAVLKRKAELAMKCVRRNSKISGQTEHVYADGDGKTGRSRANLSSY